MSNPNGWGDGSVNNNIGWGQGANNITGWGKSQLSSWSGLTDIDGGDLPTNSIAPAITGTAQEGQTLTCSTGTWSGSPTYTYQWKRNGNNIGGATSSTYLLVLADVGQNILCTVTATNFVGSANADSNTVTPTSSVDADAQAFITAASITDPTQQSAINTLVTDLKGYNIWTKMQALYPFVGGTNSQHTWNLRNTSQFQINWQGGVTHSSNGVQFNGNNSYGITGYNPSVNGSLNSHHLSFYSRTQSNGTEVEFGSIDAASGNGSLVEIRTSGVTYLRVNNGVGSISFSDSDSRAFYIANRTASNVINGWRNSTKAVNGTLASSALGTREYYLGAFNNNTVDSFHSTKQCAFASIGSGLTDTDAANFYTAVQTFQTALNRNV